MGSVILEILACNSTHSNALASFVSAALTPLLSWLAQPRAASWIEYVQQERKILKEQLAKKPASTMIRAQGLQFSDGSRSETRTWSGRSPHIPRSIKPRFTNPGFTLFWNYSSSQSRSRRLVGDKTSSSRLLVCSGKGIVRRFTISANM